MAVVFYIFVAVSQAAVGILYPVKSAWLARIQRVTQALLILAVLAIVGGTVALYWSMPYSVSLCAIIGGCVALVIAACLGAHIERCHLEEKGTSS